MNRYQKIVLYGAVINVLLMFLFPPYDVITFGRGARMFDAFHPVFAVPPNRVLNGDVLYLLTFGVLINAALAWLLLAAPRTAPGEPRIAPQTVVFAFAFANLAVVLLFPPMEAFPFAQRVTVGTFDGFYFAFGDKARRSIFVPLLYMEGLLVLINACAYWLAMSVGQRSRVADPGPQTMFAQADALRAKAERKLEAKEGIARTAVSKRGADRRKRNDPNYKGEERRRNPDRRRRPSA